jgi:hypothetical protein
MQEPPELVTIRSNVWLMRFDLEFPQGIEQCADVHGRDAIAEGPAQVGSAKEAAIAIFVNQGNKFLDRGGDWDGLVAVPLHVLTEPEDPPTAH